MRPLPRWLRRALFLTGGMNLVAGLAFLPGAAPLRAMMGFPPGGHPVYLTTVALFVALFGVGYLWTGLQGQADRIFLTLSGVGKLSFVATLVWFWAAGAVPLQAALSASPDLVFGALFLAWVLRP